MPDNEIENDDNSIEKMNDYNYNCDDPDKNDCEEKKLSAAIQEESKLDGKILKYYKQLFFYQVAVWLTSIYGVGLYLYFLIASAMNKHEYHVKKGKNVWQLVYYWQLCISIAMVLIMTVSIRMSWNSNVKIKDAWFTT